MTQDPTPADIKLIRDAYRSAPCPSCGRARACRCVVADAELDVYRFRAVLTALAKAGRLLPADVETSVQWSVRFADGHVLETSGFTEAGGRQRAAEMTKANDPAEPVHRWVGPWLPVPTNTKES